MTTLLRHSPDNVQPLEWKTTSSTIAPPPRDPAIEALEEEVTRLTAAVDEARAEAKKIAAEAYEKGRKAAEADFARDEAQRMTLLETAIQHASMAVQHQTDRLEALALMLCETALANIFDNGAGYQDRITRALEKQMKTLRRDMMLSIHVSSADFSDSALQALRQRLDAANLSIEVQTSLQPGECRIELRLGHIELSLPRYWAALKTKLHTAAAAEQPA